MLSQMLLAPEHTIDVADRAPVPVKMIGTVGDQLAMA
jgi:hypothetical protein